MAQCEVVKAKVVALDELFHFSSDEMAVNPCIDLTNATIDTKNALIKVCLLNCGNFRCENGKVTGTITFAICEDFSIVTPCVCKPVECCFEFTRDFTFQKSNCKDINGDIRLLKCQIERIVGTNTIIIIDKCTFTQKIDIEIKIVAETERILCVALCQDTGTIDLVTPIPTPCVDLI
jgi:hypothetical protein